MAVGNAAALFATRVVFRRFKTFTGFSTNAARSVRSFLSLWAGSYTGSCFPRGIVAPHVQRNGDNDEADPQHPIHPSRLNLKRIRDPNQVQRDALVAHHNPTYGAAAAAAARGAIATTTTTNFPCPTTTIVHPTRQPPFNHACTFHSYPVAADSAPLPNSQFLSYSPLPPPVPNYHHPNQRLLPHPTPFQHVSPAHHFSHLEQSSSSQRLPLPNPLRCNYNGILPATYTNNIDNNIDHPVVVVVEEAMHFLDPPNPPVWTRPDGLFLDPHPHSSSIVTTESSHVTHAEFTDPHHSSLVAPMSSSHWPPDPNGNPILLSHNPYPPSDACPLLDSMEITSFGLERTDEDGHRMFRAAPFGRPPLMQIIQSTQTKGIARFQLPPQFTVPPPPPPPHEIVAQAPRARGISRFQRPTLLEHPPTLHSQSLEHYPVIESSCENEPGHRHYFDAKNPILFPEHSFACTVRAIDPMLGLSKPENVSNHNPYITNKQTTDRTIATLRHHNKNGIAQFQKKFQSLGPPIVDVNAHPAPIQTPRASNPELLQADAKPSTTDDASHIALMAQRDDVKSPLVRYPAVFQSNHQNVRFFNEGVEIDWSNRPLDPNQSSPRHRSLAKHREATAADFDSDDLDLTRQTSLWGTANNL